MMTNYVPRNWKDKTTEQKLELLEAHRQIYLECLNGSYEVKDDLVKQIIKQWETKESLEYKQLKEMLIKEKIEGDFE